MTHEINFDRQRRIGLLILTAVIMVLYISQSNFSRFYLHISTQAVHSLSNLDEQYTTTIVTAYFPLNKSKHSLDEYRSWLENLLGFCQSPMIIYTSPDYQPILYRLRRNGSLITHFIVEYSSPFQIPPIKELLAVFEKQYSSDPERSYHSTELYAVWAAKSFMLNQSAQLNPFRTKYFLYIDAGAFRSSNYRFQGWPDKSTVQKAFVNDRILFGLINAIPRRFCPLSYRLEEGPIRHNLIEGGLIGGSMRAIQWWTSMYYKTMNNYQSKNFFIGKDQYLMNAIALTYPHQINMMLSFRSSCGNVWFAFGPLLASQVEKQNLSFSEACQRVNLSEVIIPFENICQDNKNIV